MVENSVKIPGTKEEKTSMDHQDNLIGVLKTLYKWRKPVITACLVAAIGSAVLSFLLLDNYYRSTTTFYPASADLGKPKQIFGGTAYDISYYGGEPELDRLMTIAKSGEMKKFLIDSFNLFQHYDINPELAKADSRINKKLEGLFEVKKTKYEAIELSIEDTDKELARDMVNAARNKLNEIGRNIVKANQSRVLDLMAKNMVSKKAELKILGDSLVQARKKYGVYNVSAQSELLTTMIAEAEAELAKKNGVIEVLKNAPGIDQDTIVFLTADITGLEQQIHELTNIESQSTFNLRKFNEGLGEIEILGQMLEQTKNQYSYDQQRITQFEAAYESEVPTLIIIEEGKTPLEKSRPKRSIIVLAALLVTFIASLLAVLVLEAYKDVNWKDITHAG